mgnify:CR=1 FL=1
MSELFVHLYQSIAGFIAHPCVEILASAAEFLDLFIGHFRIRCCLVGLYLVLLYVVYLVFEVLEVFDLATELLKLLLRYEAGVLEVGDVLDGGFERGQQGFYLFRAVVDILPELLELLFFG